MTKSPIVAIAAIAFVFRHDCMKMTPAPLLDLCSRLMDSMTNTATIDPQMHWCRKWLPKYTQASQVGMDKRVTASHLVRDDRFRYRRYMKINPVNDIDWLEGNPGDVSQIKWFWLTFSERMLFSRIHHDGRYIGNTHLMTDDMTFNSPNTTVISLISCISVDPTRGITLSISDSGLKYSPNPTSHKSNDLNNSCTLVVSFISECNAYCT